MRRAALLLTVIAQACASGSASSTREAPRRAADDAMTLFDQAVTDAALDLDAAQDAALDARDAASTCRALSPTTPPP